MWRLALPLVKGGIQLSQSAANLPVEQRNLPMRLLSPLALPLTLAFALSAAAAATADAPHNVVLFIADGLRYDSVTSETAPTMFELR